MQQPEEGLTDEIGEAVFGFKDIGVHYIRAEKTGYLPVIKKINMTQHFVDSGIQAISIPLVRDDLEDTEAVVILNSDCDTSSFKLYTIS
jgi:hypothetical protein